MQDLLKTPNLGTGVLEERDRVNFTTLRQARRDRVFDWMEEAGLDVCVFGREANVRYVSGARRLWTALSRPFAPTCVVLRESREVHLLSFSASYEGIPEELQPDDFYPLNWDPMVVIEHIQSLPGADSATTVGVDGLSFMFEGLLGMAFPNSALRGVQPELLDLRRVKLDDEIVCMQIAAATAEASIVAAIQRLKPGVTGKQMQAAYAARMCNLGTSQYAQQGTFAPIGGTSLPFDTNAVPIDKGDSVVLEGGVQWAGYEGSLSRTWLCGKGEASTEQRALRVAWEDRAYAVFAACRPGATGSDLLSALGGQAGAGQSSIYSMGIGHEGVLAASWLDDAAMKRQVLQPSMVLGVRIVEQSDHGAHIAEDMVLITEAGPERLTTLSHGPLAL